MDPQLARISLFRQKKKKAEVIIAQLISNWRHFRWAPIRGRRTPCPSTTTKKMQLKEKKKKGRKSHLINI